MKVHLESRYKNNNWLILSINLELILTANILVKRLYRSMYVHSTFSMTITPLPVGPQLDGGEMEDTT